MTAETKGVCPACDLRGAVGERCTERGCARRDYRFVPAPWLAAAKEKARGEVDPLIGREIGDFLVVGTIGAGGFGAVYLALQQPRWRLKAALELMHTGTSDPALAEVLVEKFQNEGDALAVLNHPNIVRLLEYGQHGGAPYLVMEYVEGGRTLHEEVRRRAVRGEPLEPATTLHILRQTVNALSSAHALGIVHRDLKPDNLMLQPAVGDPHFVRVLDFGLAKFVEERTQTSVAMGTPMYMAPEQLRRREIGPWTDLYATGIIAFELLTGRRPFAGTSAAEIAAQKIDRSYDATKRLAGLDIPDLAIDFYRRALAAAPPAELAPSPSPSPAAALGAPAALATVAAAVAPARTVPLFAEPRARPRPAQRPRGAAPGGEMGGRRRPPAREQPAPEKKELQFNLL
jgi:serine/threonine-protein kinase